MLNHDNIDDKAGNPADDSEGPTGSSLHQLSMEISGSVPAKVCTTACKTSSSLRGTAFGIFLESRRSEHIQKGITVPMMVLNSEWRRLPEAERREFEEKANLRRGCSNTGTSMAEKLRQQQQRHHLVYPAKKRIDPNEAPPSKKSKRERKEQVQQVPAPNFPARAAQLEDRADRRREVAETLKAQREGRCAQLTVASSHHVNLAEMSERVNAPTLSCDWQQLPPWEEEDGGHGLGADLEVEQPKINSDAQRSFLREELAQRISTARVQNLAHWGLGFLGCAWGCLPGLIL